MPLKPRNNSVQIASAKGYRVSESGIASNPSGAVVGSINSKGYCEISLRDEAGKTIHVKRAHLQAFQKFGARMFESGMLVRHLSGNRSDDSAANIAIGTASDNMMDIPAALRISKAGKANKKHDEQKIAQLLSEGKTYKKIMAATGISSKGTLSHIVNKILKTPEALKEAV